MTDHERNAFFSALSHCPCNKQMNAKCWRGGGGGGWGYFIFNAQSATGVLNFYPGETRESSCNLMDRTYTYTLHSETLTTETHACIVMC